MTKERYAKYILKQRELNKDKPCENCGEDHDHTYGTGRFCCEKCRNEYIASKNKSANNPKVKAHLDKLREEGKLNKKAPYGTWKCSICNDVFNTKHELTAHRHNAHNTKAERTDNGFKCPYCGEEFKLSTQVGGHMLNCNKSPTHDACIEMHRQAGIDSAKQYRLGLRVGSFSGKHHSDKTKEKMRISACNYLMNNNATPCRYNRNSIPILEEIAKEHGWSIQHAENGGEVMVIGYFLDAYDKERNIVLEYDEPAHYVDVENNVLCEKDIIRQHNIIEHLHCSYYRYNQSTGVLWRVI